MSGPRFEMLWDCPSCGSRGLLGLTHRYCPGCGAPQDETRRYFPPAGQERPVDDHPFVGADRVCGSCGAPMSAASKHCTSCGAPLGEAPLAATRSDQRAADGRFGIDDAKAARSELVPARSSEPQWAAPRRRAWPWILAVLLLVGVVGGLVLALLWTRDERFVVEGFSWERVATVEARRLVQEEAWEDAVPPGATSVRCRPEVRSHRQVPDGQTCTMVRQDLGDGTFTTRQDCRPKTRSEPVYDDRCTFLAPRWLEAQRLVSRGEGHVPVDPVVPPLREGDCLGCERPGPSDATYTVRLRGPDGAETTCAVSLQAWSALSEGQAVALPVGVLSHGVRCGALEPPGR